MAQKVTAQSGETITIEEAVPGSLTGKDDHLLSLNANGKAVLFDGTAPAIGTHNGKLAPDSTVINVRLLNAGGTVRMIQNVAITPGIRVAGVSANARVAVAATPARALGIKIAPPAAGAAGDVIEVIPQVENL